MPAHDANDIFFRKTCPRVDLFKTNLIRPSEINHFIHPRGMMGFLNIGGMIG